MSDQDLESRIAALEAASRTSLPRGGGTSKASVKRMITAALASLPELGCGWRPGFTYWVDKTYDGSLGASDGSPCRPHTTIQAAIDQAWAEVASVAYDRQATVMVAGGGSASDAYAENALVFFPFVNVIGYGTQDFVRVSSTTPIRLYGFGNYNIANLRFLSPWNADMTSGSFFGFFTWCRFWNCRFDADFTVLGRGAAQHWFELNDCYLSGSGVVDVTDVTWWMADSASYTPLTVRATAGAPAPFTAKDSLQYAAGGFWYDSFQAAPINTAQDATGNGVWLELAGRMFDTVTVNGASSKVETTGDGFPEGGLVLLSGASQFPSGDARGLKYTPSTPADWAAPAPATVGEALDRLAAANPGA